MQETGKFFYVKQIKTSDAMKKLLMIVMLAVLCQWGYSQYQPGDYYQEDSLDCVIIKVNEDGRSGLVMTLPGFITIGNLPVLLGGVDAIQTVVDNVVAFSSMQNLREGKKAIAKANTQKNVGQGFMEKRLEYLLSMSGSMGESGGENFRVVKDYCMENGLSMEEYFPEYAYVAQWGEGWFVPGDKELAYLADVIGYGLESESYKGIGASEFNSRIDEVNRKIPPLAYGKGMGKRMGIVSVSDTNEVDTAGLSAAMGRIEATVDEKLSRKGMSLEEMKNAGMSRGFSSGTKIASSSLTYAKKQVKPHVMRSATNVSRFWWEISDEGRTEWVGKYPIVISIEQDYAASFLVGVKEVAFDE